MGIKEDRHQMFNDWNTAIREQDWDTCDILAELLLHTLPQGNEQRETLQQQINHIQQIYKQESALLHQILTMEKNPFTREQLKIRKKTELDEWRAKQIHNLFMQSFMKNSLIKEEE